MIASEPIRIPARDGYGLGATVFRPPATRAVERAVLLCPAMGVKQEYYFSFAEYLAERGCAVVSFDYRGIGSSRPGTLRRFPATLRDWGRLDLGGALDWTREAFPGRPLSAVAHSVGGQIFGLAAPNGAGVGELLAFGAQSGHWRHWSGLHRLGVLSLWIVLLPALARLLGFFPSRRLGLGEDIPEGVAREWARWGRHPDYLMGRLAEEDREGYRRFAGRLRAVGSSDDRMAPPRAVRALLRFYPAARREYRELLPSELGVRSIGHFGYFRESIGERLWPGELRWLWGEGDGRGG